LLFLSLLTLQVDESSLRWQSKLLLLLLRHLHLTLQSVCSCAGASGAATDLRSADLRLGTRLLCGWRWAVGGRSAVLLLLGRRVEFKVFRVVLTVGAGADVHGRAVAVVDIRIVDVVALDVHTIVGISASGNADRGVVLKFAVNLAANVQASAVACIATHIHVDALVGDVLTIGSNGLGPKDAARTEVVFDGLGTPMPGVAVGRRVVADGQVDVAGGDVVDVERHDVEL
jgi:hypothetical protein